MNQIISNLKQSFNIKDRKLLFFVLFLMQIAFLGVIIYAAVHYFTIYIDLLNTAVQSMDQISADTLANIQQVFVLSASMKSIANIFLKGTVILYVIYAFLNGLNWNFANMFVNKRLKFPYYEIHFAVLAFIFLFPAMVLFRSIMKSLLSLGLSEPIQILFYSILIVTWYFMIISFSLINKYDLSKLKEHLKQTFILGYRKAGILIPTYVIITAVIGLSLLLINLLQDLPYLSVNLLTLIFAVIAIVWSRIYFLTTMKNL